MATGAQHRVRRDVGVRNVCDAQRFSICRGFCKAQKLRTFCAPQRLGSRDPVEGRQYEALRREMNCSVEPRTPGTHGPPPLHKVFRGALYGRERPGHGLVCASLRNWLMGDAQELPGHRPAPENSLVTGPLSGPMYVLWGRRGPQGWHASQE
jgi:hypothetical protein